MLRPLSSIRSPISYATPIIYSQTTSLHSQIFKTYSTSSKPQSTPTAQKISVKMTESKSPALSNLANLPLELRNQVYEESITPIDHISIPTSGTILSYVRARVPKALSKDSHFSGEALEASLRRTMRTAERITVPWPESFETPLPASMLWEGVKELEFTKPHAGYSSPDGNSKVSIDNVVARCPNLEKLTLCIDADLIVADDHEQVKQYRSRHVPRELFKVLEYPKMKKLMLNVHNARQAPLYEEYTYLQKVNLFVEEFDREARKRGSSATVRMELTPGVVKDPHNPEMVRHEYNGITYIQYYDFFG